MSHVLNKNKIIIIQPKAADAAIGYTCEKTHGTFCAFGRAYCSFHIYHFKWKKKMVCAENFFPSHLFIWKHMLPKYVMWGCLCVSLDILCPSVWWISFSHSLSLQNYFQFSWTFHLLKYVTDILQLCSNEKGQMCPYLSEWK